jgi:hypothetical protein
LSVGLGLGFDNFALELTEDLKLTRITMVTTIVDLTGLNKNPWRNVKSKLDINAKYSHRKIYILQLLLRDL